MKVVDSIIKLIGDTPLMEVDQLFDNQQNRIFAKLELMNPSGSIKDRIALAMIENAEKKGLLHKNSVLIEPTSGNTGIGLALVASVKGYRCIIVMPESMSLERRQLISAYGAEIILTPKEEDVRGAVDRAQRIAQEHSHHYLLDQFSNPENPAVHERTTAVEIEQAMGIPDVIVAGIGTGGTLTGVGGYFKKKNPQLQIIAIEPKSSIEGCVFHRIQGIGDGFIPENLDESLIDAFVEVNDEEAFMGMKRLLKKHGLLAGISTGAAVAALKKIHHQFQDKKILFFATDRGDRYLSMNILNEGEW